MFVLFSFVYHMSLDHLPFKAPVKFTKSVQIHMYIKIKSDPMILITFIGVVNL